MLMLALCCCCCLWLIHGAAGLCQFPGYLQTNATPPSLEPRELGADYRQRYDDATQRPGGGRRTAEQRRRDWRSGVRRQAATITWSRCGHVV